MTIQQLYSLSSCGKLVIVVCDGMDDVEIPYLGNETPWQAAHCPNMKKMEADNPGLHMSLVPDGLDAATDTAMLTLLGYSAAEYAGCRAVFEALGAGMELCEDDTVMRCNLVTFDNDAMVSHCGGNLSDSEAEGLIGMLNGRFSGPGLQFFHGHSFRNLLLLRKWDKEISCTPPHDIIGELVYPYLIKPDCELNQIMRDAAELLSRSGTEANGIWLWSPGHYKKLRPLSEVCAGISAAMVCGTDLVRGIAAGCGMKVIDVPGATGGYDTDLRAKAKAALSALAGYDIVAVHVEACDEASHRGDVAGKIRMIERIDEYLLPPLLGSGVAVAVFSDHATSSVSRRHLSRPVPLYFRG